MPLDPPVSGLADRAAVAFRAYRAGDPAGMSTLVDEVTPLLWHTARAQGLDTIAAEDAVQVTWLRLVEHAERISDPQAVLKWLLTTTRREAWGSRRRAGRVETLPTQESRDRADPRPGPEDSAVTGDVGARLWAHLERLPERCRQLLRVIAFADRPDYAAIAESLGMPMGSIGPTRGRCLAKLRAALAADPTWEVIS